MVANPCSRMKNFVMGVSRLVEKECRMTMLLNDMGISRLMVYTQKIKESKIREIRQEGKRPRSDNLVTKNLRRGCITKILQWETRISHKTEIPEVVAILLRGLGTLHVGRNIG